MLALLGEKWVQNYGYQIDYLHFHNMMEIGVCYYGEGTIVLEDKEIPYGRGGIYGSTKELSTYDKLKGKQSVAPGHGCLLMVEGFITKLYKDNSRMAQKLDFPHQPEGSLLEK